MAKDTEKLIRQLSLISYLMAARRPVTAHEIRRDVEGYAVMNEDAFARRFYADRTELDSLGISLTVQKPIDGAAEQETYSLRSESFHLPPIEFTDSELASLHTALQLLDGEFAYAEPLRLALQQITWGRPSPLESPENCPVALGITASAGGQELSARLAKIETAIFRNKTITFDYYTIERGELGSRRVDPYHLLFQGGEFYLLGYAHEREAVRVFRLSRIKGRVAYATKAEHDFRRPKDFDPRSYANKAEWQFGEQQGVAEILLSERIAWQIERHFGRYGEILPAREVPPAGAAGGHVRAGEPPGGGGEERIFRTPYASPRMIVSWVLGLGGHARLVGPPELVTELEHRLALVERGHTRPPARARGGRGSGRRAPARAAGRNGDAAAVNGAGRAGEQSGHAPNRSHAVRTRSAASGEGRDATIRPERFARLVTLAGILIHAGREGRRLRLDELSARLNVDEAELREDVSVLNLVNFGGGSYVLYAEIDEGAGEIEIDPEPYSDNFDKPARLLPVEAKALVAAIDLIGEHVGEGALASAREKIVQALGRDPLEQGLQMAGGAADDSEVARLLSRAIAARRLVELEYYKANEDELSQRLVEPYALTNGREGWYLAAFDPARDAMRHFRLDRIKRASPSRRSYSVRPEVAERAGAEEWLRTGEVQASRSARVWVSPERARWARERWQVVQERADGSVVVELRFAGVEWLAREVLREAGDAAVLEPEDAREAVLSALAKLRAVPAAA
jgi:predicted DNA-binding transcriptional regulator YafY